MVITGVMAVSAGFGDRDDFDSLIEAPALKMAAERAPETGAGLASLPASLGVGLGVETAVVVPNNLEAFARSLVFSMVQSIAGRAERFAVIQNAPSMVG